MRLSNSTSKTVMSISSAKKKAAKPAKAAKAGKKRAGGGRRPAGEDLSTYIANALTAAKGPLGISDIAAAVKKAGYNTSSANFKGIVAMRLSTNNRFKRVARGSYALGKGKK